jgi:hypothetical protein
MTSSERRFRLLTIVRQLKASGERLLEATEFFREDKPTAISRQTIQGKIDRCEAKLLQGMASERQKGSIFRIG